MKTCEAILTILLKIFSKYTWQPCWCCSKTCLAGRRGPSVRGDIYTTKVSSLFEQVVNMAPSLWQMYGFILLAVFVFAGLHVSFPSICWPVLCALALELFQISQLLCTDKPTDRPSASALYNTFRDRYLRQQQQKIGKKRFNRKKRSKMSLFLPL